MRNRVIHALARLLCWPCIMLCAEAMAQTGLPSANTASLSVTPEKRIALVIGNAKYKDAPLANPVNDAHAMAKALGETGFAVTELDNAGQQEMQLALRKFGDAIRNGGVGLFYFAGHGMQVKGRNSLIPVDAEIEREDEVAYKSLDVGQVLDKMEAAGNRLNIVILDACRNNPFARKFRSSSSGLAQMDAPVGTLIAFATAPGSVARDGQGANGLYTQHLLRAMKQPGTRIEDVFKNVRAGVRKESQGHQIPWESTSLEGDFVFNPLPPKASNVPGQSDATSVKRIDHIDAPRLKPGDSWTTQTIDLLNGSVIEENTLTLADGTAGEWRFEHLVTDTSWNAIREMSGARVMRKWVPSRSRFRFPMQVGNAWSATYTMEDDDYTIFFIVDFKVIRQERIVVPAGVFDCLRVEGTQKYKSTRKKDGSNGEGTNVHRYWFSPEAGWIAAYESEVTNWKGVVSRKTREELISYKR